MAARSCWKVDLLNWFGHSRLPAHRAGCLRPRGSPPCGKRLMRCGLRRWHGGSSRIGRPLEGSFPTHRWDDRRIEKRNRLESVLHREAGAPAQSRLDRHGGTSHFIVVGEDLKQVLMLAAKKTLELCQLRFDLRLGSRTRAMISRARFISPGQKNRVMTRWGSGLSLSGNRVTGTDISGLPDWVDHFADLRLIRLHYGPPVARTTSTRATASIGLTEYASITRTLIVAFS